MVAKIRKQTKQTARQTKQTERKKEQQQWSEHNGEAVCVCAWAPKSEH